VAPPFTALIRFDRVSRRFGSRVALDEVSFEAGEGEIVALLGPNGAGKSTAFGLMLGHLRPTAGEVLVHGVSVMHDRRHALRRTGAVPESPALYDDLTGFENVCSLAAYSGTVDPAAVAEALEFVGLTDRCHDRARGYSRGMRQRLALAQALVPTPDLVLLDEPVEGLDPEGIATMHALVRRLGHERGITVVMASHLLSELETICDRVIVLEAGRLAYAGTVPAGVGLAALYHDVVAAARSRS
jgi:ABC-2 type transport system ATP-binding protein